MDKILALVHLVLDLVTAALPILEDHIEETQNGPNKESGCKNER